MICGPCRTGAELKIFHGCEGFDWSTRTKNKTKCGCQCRSRGIPDWMDHEMFLTLWNLVTTIKAKAEQEGVDPKKMIDDEGLSIEKVTPEVLAR